MDTFTYIVSALLITFLFTDIAAAYLLTRTSARANYSLIALNERAFVASVQAVSAGLLSLLGANRILDWHFSEPIVLVILSIALLIQAAPSIGWLLLYVRHRFDPDDQG